MSVAEILAAARQADSPEPAASVDPPTAEPSPPATSPTAAKKTAQARPSVAEMLALARAQKSPDAAAQPAASQATTKKKPQGTAQARPSVAEMLAQARGQKSSDKAPQSAAKKPTARKTAATPPAKTRHTRSILAAPPQTALAGPLSKSAAAAQAAGKNSQAAAQPQAHPAGFSSPHGATLLHRCWSTLKFLLPRFYRRPPAQVTVGFPHDFPAGQVQTKYVAEFGIWVANADYNGQRQLYALQAACTQHNCTTNWLAAEQKFKCPAHGCSFRQDGSNCAGPASRPLERCAIHLTDDGQVEIDTSRTFRAEMGQWDNPACFIPQ